jgi:uncharacterized protein YdeI (YjbR/CyaY-like superfamily)
VDTRLQELVVEDAPAWRAWLDAHHAEEDAVWLVLAKKGTTEPTTLTYDQALEEALCFGWIDGQGRRRDDSTSLQRFTPRRRRSTWSKRNVGIAERLIEEKRMRPAGLAEIERAKADGRWEAAYAGLATIEVPPDLADALAAEPRARAMFETLTSRNRPSAAGEPEHELHALDEVVDGLDAPGRRSRPCQLRCARLARFRDVGGELLGRALEVEPVVVQRLVGELHVPAHGRGDTAGERESVAGCPGSP